LPLTHGGEAPWQRESRQEEAAAHCFGVAALLFIARRPGWCRREGQGAQGAKAGTPRTAVVCWRHCAGGDTKGRAEGACEEAAA
jgi:hypothetical protein